MQILHPVGLFSAGACHLMASQHCNLQAFQQRLIRKFAVITGAEGMIHETMKRLAPQICPFVLQKHPKCQNTFETLENVGKCWEQSNKQNFYFVIGINCKIHVSYFLEKW